MAIATLAHMKRGALVVLALTGCTMGFDQFRSSDDTAALPTSPSSSAQPNPSGTSSSGGPPVTTNPDASVPDASTEDAGPPCDEPDLVARWTFDGHVRDCSSNHLDGAIAAPSFSQGHLGQAIDFDGTQFVSFGNALATKQVGALTVMAWVKATLPATSSEWIVGKGSNLGISGWRLGLESSNTTSFTVARGNNTEFIAASCNCGQSTWFHLAGVFSPGAFVRLYVNGKLIAESTVAPPTTLIDAPVELRAGARGDGYADSYFKGSLDDLRLYSRAFNTAEVASIASQ